ncbi:MAG: 50S ribosomal protein L11 methyltransferase [Chlorobi bacterium]|nr:50S ribosomal protein L11 methyltransferase [Chlorobiota bacterium]
MKNFDKFEITASPFNPDLIGGVLWQLPILGITEEDDKLIVYSESGKVTQFQLKEILLTLVKQNLIESFFATSQEIEDRNWNEEWEKKTPVIEISEKIVIKPSFKNYKNDDGKIVIEIDPKMSFGTGEHETTRLTMKMLEKYIAPDLRILDVGTGTGILAIAAAKLAPQKFVLGIDNDEWCELNGNENVKANKVDDVVKIKLAETGEIEDKDFDMVLANINKNVLKSIAEHVSTKLKTGGHIILSGLLTVDEEEIISLYAKFNCRFEDKSVMNEWSALSFMKE